MNLVLVLRAFILLFIIFFSWKLWKDCRKNGPKDVPLKHTVLYGIMGFVLNLLDTLGVGSNATQAAFFKLTKLSPDEELPGNGNVIFAVPVGVEALLFMKIVEVEPVTLFSMLIAAMLGGIVGAKFIVKSMPITILTYIVAVVLVYMAVNFIITNRKDRRN